MDRFALGGEDAHIRAMPMADQGSAPAVRDAPHRRWRRVLGAIAGAGALSLALLPFWAPWIVPGLVRSLGVEVAGCVQEGYWRLALQEVRYESAGTRFEAERVELLNPWGYVVDRLAPGRVASSSAPAVRVSDWTLSVQAEAGDGAGEGSISDVLDSVQSGLRQLRSWLPTARLERGKVQVAGEELNLPKVGWGEGRLRVEAHSVQRAAAVRAELAVVDKEPVTLFRTAIFPARARAALTQGLPTASRRSRPKAGTIVAAGHARGPRPHCLSMPNRAFLRRRRSS